MLSLLLILCGSIRGAETAGIYGDSFKKKNPEAYFVNAKGLKTRAVFLEKENGKHGVVYPRRGAICLESQHYPDTPNHPDFPSAVLEPGQTYKSECIYKFTTK